MPPDILHDDVFGELFYDVPMDEWCAEVALTPNHKIEIAIWWEEEKDGPFAPVLERARAAFQDFLQREGEHRQALAAALVQRYRGCTQEDEELPAPEEIARGLSASRIAIAADGSATVHYDDAAELFGDHCIFADLDADGRFLGFTLHG
jgi:hypothetical protein